MRKGLMSFVLVVVLPFALADDPDESKLDGPALARSVVGYLQADPPNLEMALDRLKDAQEDDKLGSMDARVLQLAQGALEAGVPEAVPSLIAKAVGDDPKQVSGSVVEVRLGPAIYWAFGVGLLAVFTGAYLVGRQAKQRPFARREA
jgi:hypothetical protein